MKEIIFIGDVHGQWAAYRRVIDQYPNTATVQVGDMGFGFPGWEKTDPHGFPMNHRFIRGNHDNPAVIRRVPNYLGDYGYNEELGIFYVGGGYSIDWQWRTEGSSWWRDEEVDNNTALKVLELYASVQPNIVVTHDCPKEIQRFLISHHEETSRTNQLLQAMFNEHHPKLWVFGHHHKPFQTTILGTRFVCVPEAMWQGGSVKLSDIYPEGNE